MLIQYVYTVVIQFCLYSLNIFINYCLNHLHHFLLILFSIFLRRWLSIRTIVREYKHYTFFSHYEHYIFLQCAKIVFFDFFFIVFIQQHFIFQNTKKKKNILFNKIYNNVKIKFNFFCLICCFFLYIFNTRQKEDQIIIFSLHFCNICMFFCLLIKKLVKSNFNMFYKKNGYIRLKL